MLKRYAAPAAVILLLLSACRPELTTELDNQIVCSMKSRAYHVTPAIGDTSRLRRVPVLDRLCAK